MQKHCKKLFSFITAVLLVVLSVTAVCAKSYIVDTDGAKYEILLTRKCQNHNNFIGADFRPFTSISSPGGYTSGDKICRKITPPQSSDRRRGFLFDVFNYSLCGKKKRPKIFKNLKNYR